MKKLLIILLVIALCLPCFAGCDATHPEEQENAGNGGEINTSAAADNGAEATPENGGSTEANTENGGSTEANTENGESTEANTENGESTEANTENGSSTEANTENGESTEANTEGNSTEAITEKNEESDVEADGVSLDKESISLTKGGSETLTATITPADTTDKSLTWSSSDMGVATVSDGVVTAIGAGTATITVTTANGKSATCEVTVTVVALGVTLDRSAIQINVGEASALVATVSPADTTDKALTWSSSDTSVAAVSDGVVTAIGAGTATITVTTANGKSATCSVTVISNGIGFKTLEINGTEVYGKVSNSTTTFSFLNEVEKNGNATYEVYRDLECTDLIRSKTASLQIGDNTFYVLEYVGGEVNALYTVTVRRRPMYTVTFNTVGGTNVAAQTVEEDSFATVPTTERVGYTFAGWDRDLTLPITDNTEVKAQWTGLPFVVTYDANTGTVGNATANVVTGLAYDLEIPTKTGYTFVGWYYGTRKIETTGTWDIAEDVTLKAKWRANTNTAYKVEHYIEMLDGTYELKDTDNLTGTSNTRVTPNTKSYTGFTAPEKQTVTILPDGTLCVRYEYTRNSYTVTFVTNGGNTIADQTLQYEAALPTPQRSCLSFGGWFSDVNLSTAVVTVPAKNITLYAYWTEENKPSDFTYSGSSSITITKYNSSDATARIPSYIGGKAVTSIGSDAFRGCSGLTSITIPEGVTSIGDWAFNGCSGLTIVTFAENSKLRSIGYSSFYGCSGLTSVTIPSSVTSIGNWAFGGCTGLTSISIPFVGATKDGTINTRFEYIFGFSFPTSLKTVIITGGSSISDSAFYGCSGLTSITIPDSVTSIGEKAFYNCTGLTSITIPDSVTSIGEKAFYGCYKLVEIINHSTLALSCGLKDNGYVACYAKEIHQGPSKIVNQNGYLFYTYNGINYLMGYVGGDTELTLPQDYNGELYEMCRYAFSGCSGLTSITIPDSVKSISDSAFSDCSGLTSINYNGTKAQWSAITKRTEWNSDTGNYTIYCTDGTISK